jgi:serine/threonine-protein kinase RsbW
MLKAGLDKNLILKILTACEEIIVNVIKYAYPVEKGYIEISIDNNEGNISIAFADSGIPFNPLKKEDADVELKIEERKAGGLGIFLVKNIMDDVNYEYKNKNNILTIKKKIEH